MTNQNCPIHYPDPNPKEQLGEIANRQTNPHENELTFRQNIDALLEMEQKKSLGIYIPKENQWSMVSGLRHSRPLVRRM